MHRSLDARIVKRDSGCWDWTGSTTNGRGMVMIDGKRLLVYRLMYERHVGPIPPDGIMHHTCERPICVNPEHLKLTTRQDHKSFHRKPKRPDPGNAPCKHGHRGAWALNSQGRWFCRLCARIASHKSNVKQRPKRREQDREKARLRRERVLAAEQERIRKAGL